MLRNFAIDIRVLTLGFAIGLNVAIAAASFPMISIVQSLHVIGDANVESGRLIEAARMAVYFSLLPLAAFFIASAAPITPISPQRPDPVYEDVASTIQILTSLAICALVAVGAVLRMAGLDPYSDESAFIQVIVFGLATIYMVLLSDPRKSISSLRLADKAVLVSIVAVCLIFVKRDVLLLAIPLLVSGRTPVRLWWIAAAVGVAAAIILLNMAVRGNLDLTSTVIRVFGGQFKYLERYSFNFGMYDQCYGVATLWAFLDNARYKAFYDLIFDPVTLSAGGASFRWDSANLQERLNYAYCSVPIANFIYFGAIAGLLFLEKKLADVRYFRAALLIILFSYGGFQFYNIPQATALLLLCLSGFWRLGGAAVLGQGSGGAPSRDVRHRPN